MDRITIDARYRSYGQMFSTVKQREGISYRELSRTLKVRPSTLCRFSQGKDINAKAYLAIMLWTTMHNRNIV